MIFLDCFPKGLCHLTLPPVVHESSGYHAPLPKLDITYVFSFRCGIILISFSLMANEVKHLFMFIGYLGALLFEAAALSLLLTLLEFFPLIDL